MGNRLVSEDSALSHDVAVPGEWLEVLAVRVRLHRTEWCVIAIVLCSSDPVSASGVAKRLRLDYGLIKRVVRELARWNILERTPEGLRFSPITPFGDRRVPGQWHDCTTTRKRPAGADWEGTGRQGALATAQRDGRHPAHQRVPHSLTLRHWGAPMDGMPAAPIRTQRRVRPRMTSRFWRAGLRTK
jgi:hypothetical protein